MRQTIRRLLQTLLSGIAVAAAVLAGAQEDSGADAAAMAVQEAARAALVSGPTTLALIDQAELRLPEGYGFIPAQEAAAVMELMGNHTDTRFVGLIVPRTDADWMVVIEYDPSGFIKDDDAKDWNADELLQNLREGTEASNAEREQRGIPAIIVSRWIEPPAYQPDTHRLVWSAEVKLKEGEDPDPTVNYNTYVLGREGFISLNLVTPSSSVEADKQAAHELLAAVSFNAGKRYTEFDSSTDKVAAYGLAALIGGVAAKKLGLLAMLGVLVVKFGKVLAIGAAVLGGGVVKWFRGKRSD